MLVLASLDEKENQVVTTRVVLRQLQPMPLTDPLHMVRSLKGTWSVRR